MSEGEDLLGIPSGGDIKKYALRVFKALFSQEEMAEGAGGPIECIRIQEKVQVNEERVVLIKHKCEI